MKTFLKIDIDSEEHCNALLALLNDYMEDKMGIKKSMPKSLGPKIIEGLKEHKAYLGCLVQHGDEFVALANCNLNYSTWKANFIINIHDFVVSPTCRNQGMGAFLMKGITAYAKEMGYCKLNLEVREDNLSAQRLYKKNGFCEGEPAMHFLQMEL